MTNKQTVELATVRLPRLEGQGVIVPGGYILTAAHCVGWTATGFMALDGAGEHLEPVELQGRDFQAAVDAVEPVRDIAALGSPDDQRFFAEFDQFSAVMDEVKAIEPATEEHELFEQRDAIVLTHDKGWVDVTVQQCAEGAPVLMVKAAQKIEGGTSGGPVVDKNGRLLGVVSWTSEQTFDGTFNGMITRPHRALPVWLVEKILAGGRD